jgi:ParB/RepB/Spo0J family partition protein
LKELAASIRSQGVLSPLLVRPLNDRSFEIVAGARRYRAAQMALGYHLKTGHTLSLQNRPTGLA